MIESLISEEDKKNPGPEKAHDNLNEDLSDEVKETYHNSTKLDNSYPSVPNYKE